MIISLRNKSTTTEVAVDADVLYRQQLSDCGHIFRFIPVSTAVKVQLLQALCLQNKSFHKFTHSLMKPSENVCIIYICKLNTSEIYQ